MKVVLDTNVLVSGIFWKGPPNRILQLWLAGRFELLTSTEILDEYRRVAEELNQKYPRVDLRPLMDLITLRSHLVQPGPGPLPYCQDPDDIKFLAAALAGRAKFLVSGDRHLLRVGRYPRGRVVTAADFLREVGP